MGDFKAQIRLKQRKGQVLFDGGTHMVDHDGPFTFVGRMYHETNPCACVGRKTSNDANTHDAAIERLDEPRVDRTKRRPKSCRCDRDKRYMCGALQ